MKLIAMSAITMVLATSATVHAAGPMQVRIAEKQPYGKYLSDATGRALYVFTADARGVSNCNGACAQAWPPLKSDTTPQVGAGVMRGMLGLIRRNDGSAQVTYNGKPLYYFAGDQKPSTTAGEGIDAQGGEWYLVSPTGDKIDED